MYGVFGETPYVDRSTTADSGSFSVQPWWGTIAFAVVDGTFVIAIFDISNALGPTLTFLLHPHLPLSPPLPRPRACARYCSSTSPSPIGIDAPEAPCAAGERGCDYDTAVEGGVYEGEGYG